MLRCIFHIPYKLNINAVSAPMLRPKMMIKGFSNIGYLVDVIEGTMIERKRKIEEVKLKISSGVRYDFMYAESSTMPTLLTEKHHLPLHPFLDFSFFKFVKKHNIKIGLFYRDIYWKFDSYKKDLSVWKSYLAIKCYKHDIKKYEQLLDKFYLPSLKMCSYINSSRLERIAEILPPGCVDIIDKEIKIRERDFSKKALRIFYVGGLGNQYQISELMGAMNNLNNCELVICCREEEWKQEKENLESYMYSNIYIIHKKNQELEEEYKRADICSLMFKPDAYRDMAMPYKAFEYLAHCKPVLATKNTAIGEFVSQNDIGWSIEYGADEIKTKLSNILNNPELLQNKIEHCTNVRRSNTWTERARKVSHAFINISKPEMDDTR